PLKVVAVDEAEHAVTKAAERLLRYSVLVLLGLKVPSGEQRYEILELTASKLRGKRHPKHVSVGRVVEIVGYVPQPRHSREIVRRRKSRIALLDASIELRRDCQMTEIIDRLSELISA